MSLGSCALVDRGGLAVRFQRKLQCHTDGHLGFRLDGILVVWVSSFDLSVQAGVTLEASNVWVDAVVVSWRTQTNTTLIVHRLIRFLSHALVRLCLGFLFAGRSLGLRSGVGFLWRAAIQYLTGPGAPAGPPTIK
jgi:hypothetical protein